MQRKNSFLVSWIPSKFAKVGGVVKLKDDGKWTDGWVIEWTGFTGEIPEEPKKLIKDHRKATGDSLPKIKDEEDGDVVDMRAMRKSRR